MPVVTTRLGRYLRATCVVSLAVVHASVAIAQDDPSAKEFFSRVNRAVSTLAGKTGKEADSACLALVSSLFDLDGFARLIAAAAWDRMTAEQRAAYRAVLKRRAVGDCVSENKNKNGDTAIFLGIRETDSGDRLLATRIGRQNSAGGRTLIWRLHGSGAQGGLRAIDLLVDGRSTVLSLRDEASALLERSNGDINALIRGLGQ